MRLELLTDAFSTGLSSVPVDRPNVIGVIRSPLATAYHHPMPDDDQAEDEPEFEDVVAALLKVDPEGIIGKEGKTARDKGREPKAPKK